MNGFVGLSVLAAVIIIITLQEIKPDTAELTAFYIIPVALLQALIGSEYKIGSTLFSEEKAPLPLWLWHSPPLPIRPAQFCAQRLEASEVLACLRTVPPS